MSPFIFTRVVFRIISPWNGFTLLAMFVSVVTSTLHEYKLQVKIQVYIPKYLLLWNSLLEIHHFHGYCNHFEIWYVMVEPEEWSSRFERFRDSEIHSYIHHHHHWILTELPTISVCVFWIGSSSLSAWKYNLSYRHVNLRSLLFTMIWGLILRVKLTVMIFKKNRRMIELHMRTYPLAIYLKDLIEGF